MPGLLFRSKMIFWMWKEIPKKPENQWGIDAKNSNATYVSIMGAEAARKELWEQYCRAAAVLEQLSCKTTFLKHLLELHCSPGLLKRKGLRQATPPINSKKLLASFEDYSQRSGIIRSA